MPISDQLRNLLQEKGASLVGFADLSALPEDVRDFKHYGISIGVALNPVIIKGIKNGPTLEYHAEYKRVNELLAGLSESASRLLIESGFDAIAKPPTQTTFDPQTRSTILPHKTVATRAGIGWIGKCALLVTKEYGSALRITTVLTNAELETGSPVNESNCGECVLCVEACPGQAPAGTNWNVNIHRDLFFNAAKCAETAANNALIRIGVKETICGICIAVCPWTEKYVAKGSI